MVVLVLGSGGRVGSPGATAIAKMEGVTKVICGDLNVDAVSQVARQIGDKAEVVRIDVFDHEALVRLMKNASIVVNYAGPGVTLAPLVAEAALEAKIHLVDVQDDAGAIPSLLALDEAAKDAGLTMVTGAGVSPGITNLLAKYGSTKLDKTNEIRFSWLAHVSPPFGVGIWGHRLSLYNQQVPIFDNGEYSTITGGTGEETVVWPEPVGSGIVRFCDHPEPVTLPRYIKGVQHVSCKGGYVAHKFGQFLKYMSGLGFGGTKPVQIGKVSVSPMDFFRHYAVTGEFQQTDAYKDMIEEMEPISVDSLGCRIELKGEKAGKLTKLVYNFMSTDLAAATAYPAAVIAHHIATGKLQDKGMMCLEALDAKPILDELAKMGLPYSESFE